MKIGLIDVDGHNFPNLALMKLSAFHKSKGDTVEKLFAMDHYDKVYMSKIFDFTKDFETCINADEIVKGGRAYDKVLKLPDEIEHMYPDYELYDVENVAYGQLTRGCPRGCDFCDVQNIEGLISYQVADLNQFWRNQDEIKLLDPNILASKDRLKLLQQLANSKACVDFTQGLDVRLLNDDAIDILRKVKVKMLHFAWDKRDQDELIIKNLKYFTEHSKLDMRRKRVYVLVNFNTTTEEDLERIYKLRELDYDPYVMIYDKHEFVNEETKRLYPMKKLLMKYTYEQIEHFKICWKIQRWVNNKYIWYSGESNRFEDYKNRGK